MSKGAPDYSKMVLLQALDGSGNLIPVLLDNTGKILAVLQGSDGGILRTLKVDSNGQLIALIKGSGGETISVDANGYFSALMKGVTGTGTLQTIKVDSSGQLIAAIKGSGGETIAVDTNGYLAALMKGVTGAGALQTIKIDSSGQLIAAIKGSNGETIAVDANGYLAALMKGQKDDGTLKTISVDDTGKMRAYIYDPANIWGSLVSIGLAEAASRVGRPISIDKQGEYVFTDDFEAAVLHWCAVANGTGSSVALATDRAHNGNQSVKIVTGSDGLLYSYITRHESTTKSATLGLQVSANIYSFINGTYFNIIIIRRTGARIYTFQITIDYYNGIIYYKDYSGGLTYLGVMPNFYNVMCAWTTMKLVGNSVTGKYVRFIYGSTSWDMSAISAYYTVSSAYTDDEFQLYNSGVAGQNFTTYVDDVIVTVNEV